MGNEKENAIRIMTQLQVKGFIHNLYQMNKKDGNADKFNTIKDMKKREKIKNEVVGKIKKWKL